MNVYQKITDQILVSLEAGTKPWSKSWIGGASNLLPLRSCGTPYRGINVIMLWSESMSKGYSSNYWLTYKKAQELGGQVRKGEKSTMAVFASKFDKKETKDGSEVTKHISFLKAYSVFNADQIDSLPERFRPATVTDRPKLTLIAAAEEFFNATGAKISHGGNRAHYRPATDSIVLPTPEQFQDAEAYASTKAHELVHWTGHASRLDRPLNNQFGNEGYAREELVAELGSAFLCSILGISNEPREDHAQYLSAWIKTLKEDNRCIVQAASKAQAACDYLQVLAMPKQVAA